MDDLGPQRGSKPLPRATADGVCCRDPQSHSMWNRRPQGEVPHCKCKEQVNHWNLRPCAKGQRERQC